ncbi:MAG: pantoate--beta-alanine ligase [Treponemataceae bacterium]|nr:pantoate--beta-alanine ligase [Treponemataceae bacterium]
MKIIRTVSEWKAAAQEAAGRTIGFVPTMGGLHEGHASLVRRSRAENAVTAVSVYLNPTQFNDKKDFETYPADFSEDAALLEAEGADFLFAPDYAELYPDDYRYKVVETDFSRTLCGASRPGHFDGVLTVVMKLLNIIRPSRAYFGEKDFQQYTLLVGMARAFFLDVEIVPCPIVREESGLAISSRNRRLSGAGREKAAEFHQILSEGGSAGEKKRRLEGAGFSVDYVEERGGRLYGAVFLEGVRLIDNVQLDAAAQTQA